MNIDLSRNPGHKHGPLSIEQLTWAPIYGEPEVRPNDFFDNWDNPADGPSPL